MQSASPQRAAWWKVALLAAIVGGTNILLWGAAHQAREVEGLAGDGKLYGMAYAPFQRDQSPLLGQFPGLEQVRSDLQLLAPFTHAIRTYTSSQIPEVPGIAAEFGLAVNAGAWVGEDLANNRLELDALYAAAQRYPNIDRAIVGNEALLRGDVSMAQMVAYLDEARAQLNVPVSTAENWDLWLAQPELVRHVDYIAVHLLPYWEGVNQQAALARALERLAALRAKYPGKPIVVGEIGWPSAGERFQNSVPSLATQARFARQFANRARELGVDYYLMEAIDQPWKQGEGKVGAYWGMFDANRQQKWPLRGPVQEDVDWALKAVLSAALALAPIVWFARRFGRFKWWGRLFFAVLIQSGAALVVWLIGVPIHFYLSWLDWAMFCLLLPAYAAIVAIIGIIGFEFTEAVAQKHWLRRFDLQPLAPGAVQPKVSIHLACCNEPPEMVMATLDSIAALDYRNFEVLVIDNNTLDDALWQPVRAHCGKLGPRFAFHHLSPWPGYKAGALNFALEQTDRSSDIVAVVDSDYTVHRDWLSSLVGHFADTRVALVQCPQAHRDFEQSAFGRMCNFEFEGFFRIGMHHRNERNAIIQHGTMTMVRASALRAVGGWAEWCICEDAELGLKLMESGWQTRYVDEVMGRGLTPSDFLAYKRQRFRWAFGAMQILKAHATQLVFRSSLDPGQRYHFLTGWFSWFADALHLIFTVMVLAWTLGMLVNREWFAMPLVVFLIPVLSLSVFKAVLGVVLYRVRVPCSWTDCLGAALASMALSHTIARGIVQGLFSRAHPFERTDKSRTPHRPGGPSGVSALRVVREELALLLALLAAATALGGHLGWDAPEVQLWLVVLLAQALPYASAVLVCRISDRAASTNKFAAA